MLSKKVMGALLSIAMASSVVSCSSSSSGGDTPLVTSLTKIPSGTEMFAVSGDASLSSPLHSFAVSGTPPKLVDAMASGSSVQSYFYPNLLTLSGEDSLENIHDHWGSLSTEEKNAVREALRVGDSGCYMSQSALRSISNIAENTSSVCYMKNAPEASGALTITSGAEDTDENKIHIFDKQTASRIVKVNAGDQYIFIKVYGSSTDEAANNNFRTDLWFCNPSAPSDPALSYEKLVYDASTSKLIITHYTGQDSHNFSSVLTAYLKDENGTLTFDPAREKTAAVTWVGASGQGKFKSNISVLGDAMTISDYWSNTDESSYNRRYLYSQFTGESPSLLRFFGGGSKSMDNIGGDATFVEASEFQDSFYADGGESSSFYTAVSSFDFTGSSFFASFPAIESSISSEISSYSCSTTPDITLEMNMNDAMAAVQTLCEADHLDGGSPCDGEVYGHIRQDAYSSM